MEWKQRMAIMTKNKKMLVAAFPEASLLDESGIYAFTRTDETGLKFAYVGQAKKVLTRLAQHLMGHEQHIDLSLRNRKLRTRENPNGWGVTAFYCKEELLDEKERETILMFALHGYQLYNKTAGGQNEGKIGIAPNAPSKGYRDGLKQGYENARRDVAKWFKNKLVVSIDGKEGVRKTNALNAFQEFICGADKIEDNEQDT